MAEITYKDIIFYECRCLRCGKIYQSKNKDDLDGDGKCASCLEKHKQIAEQVDMQQRMIMGNRPTSEPRVLPTVEGTIWINAKTLLGK